jgi:cytochrome c oxidase cbb3-type subunit 4
MDITTMRIVATLASLACFVGIWWWAYARRNQARFEEAASCHLIKTDFSTRTRTSHERFH